MYSRFFIHIARPELFPYVALGAIRRGRNKRRGGKCKSSCLESWKLYFMVNRRCAALVKKAKQEERTERKLRTVRQCRASSRRRERGDSFTLRFIGFRTGCTIPLSHYRLHIIVTFQHTKLPWVFRLSLHRGHVAIHKAKWHMTKL